MREIRTSGSVGRGLRPPYPIAHRVGGTIEWSRANFHASRRGRPAKIMRRTGYWRRIFRVPQVQSRAWGPTQRPWAPHSLSRPATIIRRFSFCPDAHLRLSGLPSRTERGADSAPRSRPHGSLSLVAVTRLRQFRPPLLGCGTRRRSCRGCRLRVPAHTITGRIVAKQRDCAPVRSRAPQASASEISTSYERPSGSPGARPNPCPSSRPNARYRMRWHRDRLPPRSRALPIGHPR
jgi:hypothetical protein